ncbi:MAG: His/Gly/Thr/Pro-type tRNA ligase C-terminal domain-containing protein, partial [Longicatena sp.]
CYGFGLERCMASIVEQHNDEAGIVWPMEVAPYQVALVIVSLKDEEQVRVANELYETLKSKGIDVILDDRNERVGVKFKDMELIGIPYRITIGRGISEGNVEFRERNASENENVKVDEIVEYVLNKLK